jgi:hypothetical protein
MQIILNRFKKYYPEYDAKDKELHLYGKIPMEEWIELRLLIKVYNIELNNLRVN